MKKCLIFLVAMSSCSTRVLEEKNLNGEMASSLQNSKQYFVYKIDSIHNWYLIYARKQDSIFKIISKKEPVIDGCSKKIVIGRSYDFKLHSVLGELYKLFGGEDKISGSFVLDLSGYGVDDSTHILFERDSINDLQFVSNVKGLCKVPGE